MSAFGGFPPELFAFFTKLKKDNSQSFWNAHKTQWERHVRDPMRAMIEELTEEFGPLRMFRPNRDVRRWKGAALIREWNKTDWMHTPHALGNDRDTWRAAAPLKTWLDAHVGQENEPQAHSLEPTTPTSMNGESPAWSSTIDSCSETSNGLNLFHDRRRPKLGHEGLPAALRQPAA